MSNALMLIGTTGDRPVHLIYGQETGDHRPFVLVTVTPEYVAHKISKTLPMDPKELALFIHDYADDLMKLAVSCRDRGKTGAILTATLPEAPQNLICTMALAKERKNPVAVHLVEGGEERQGPSRRRLPALDLP